MSDVFAFKGRMSRARYWGLTSLCMLALFASSLSVALTANYTSAPPVNVVAVVVAIVGVVIFFAMCVALFGVGGRRLHDRGKSALWIILYYAVPFIMAVLGVDPESQGVALDCIALAIVVWAIIDLGILEGKAADYGPVAA
jgi:uncharacterized membrane protein YhaH (DUF805 family)